MPARRYYCYYCDVSFPYSREARKRHNSGHAHVRLANQHYQQYQNDRERYNTELNREKCRKFLSGKGCNFGEECIYSHSTPQQLQELRLKSEQEAILEEYGPLPSQVTSALPTETPTNILTLDNVAVMKIIVAQRRQQLLSLYPALLLPYNQDDRNGHQNPAGAANLDHGMDRGLETAPRAAERLNCSTLAASDTMNTQPPFKLSEEYFQSKLREGSSGVSTLLPPSMRPYSLDAMLSKPLPEWG